MEEKIAREVCEQEFKRFLEAMDLELDEGKWTDDDRKSFDKARESVMRAIARGSLTIDESGQPVFVPQSGDQQPIVFYEPDGKALISIDQAKKDHDAQKTINLLAAITRQKVARFMAMKNRDMKVCQALLGLFLGSG